MTRRNGKQIHLNRLVPSLPGHVDLAKAVEERFILLCNIHLGMTGVQLTFPKSLDRDVMRWREMVGRHRRGDFRHTDAELLSVQTVAQWTVDEHRKLRKQPSEKLEWR